MKNWNDHTEPAEFGLIAWPQTHLKSKIATRAHQIRSRLLELLRYHFVPLLVSVCQFLGSLNELSFAYLLSGLAYRTTFKKRPFASFMLPVPTQLPRTNRRSHSKEVRLYFGRL